MSDKLLPCPHCGGEATPYVNIEVTKWIVACDECGASVPEESSEEEAAAAWNRRTNPPPVPLTVEQLREIRENHDWIWIVNLDNGTGKWAAIDRITPASSVEDEAIWWNVAGDRHGDKTTLRDYGKTWLAYDRKPEEGSQ